jgi:hypothetical protein
MEDKFESEETIAKLDAGIARIVEFRCGFTSIPVYASLGATAREVAVSKCLIMDGFDFVRVGASPKMEYSIPMAMKKSGR